MLFRGLCKFGMIEWTEAVLLQIAISMEYDFRQVSNIRRTSVCNGIIDHPDVVGASPVGAAPTTSSLST